MHRRFLAYLALSWMAACASPPPAAPTQTAAAEQCKRPLTGTLIERRVPCVAKSGQDSLNDQRNVDSIRDRMQTMPRSTGMPAP